MSPIGHVLLFPNLPSRGKLNANIAEAQRTAANIRQANQLQGGNEQVHLMTWLYFQVKNKAVWDYKYDDTTFKQEERVSRYEAFGNYNFGAVGAAMGLSPDLLLRAAGIANRIAADGLSFEAAKQIFLSQLFDPNRGDAPEDQENIRKGVQYFSAYQLGCCRSNDIQT